MFKKILVPVDGSRTSRLGLEEAIKLAKDQGAVLYLLHVLEEQITFQDPSIAAGTFIDEYLKAVQETGKEIISNAEEIAKKAHVRAKSFMLETFSGGTADLIVKQAKKLKVDLIVLGTHGRRGLKRMVMGSDAEGVVRDTPVPVLLVRSSAPAIRTRGKGKRAKGSKARSAKH